MRSGPAYVNGYENGRFRRFEQNCGAKNERPRGDYKINDSPTLICCTRGPLPSLKSVER